MVRLQVIEEPGLSAENIRRAIENATDTVFNILNQVSMAEVEDIRELFIMQTDELEGHVEMALSEDLFKNMYVAGVHIITKTILQLFCDVLIDNWAPNLDIYALLIEGRQQMIESVITEVTPLIGG